MSSIVFFSSWFTQKKISRFKQKISRIVICLCSGSVLLLDARRSLDVRSTFSSQLLGGSYAWKYWHQPTRGQFYGSSSAATLAITCGPPKKKCPICFRLLTFEIRTSEWRFQGKTITTEPWSPGLFEKKCVGSFVSVYPKECWCSATNARTATSKLVYVLFMSNFYPNTSKPRTLVIRRFTNLGIASWAGPRTR